MRAGALEEFYTLWMAHEVVVHGRGRRTASGYTPGDGTVVPAAVSVSHELVTTQVGEELVAAAQVCWRPDGPMPRPGDELTLPADFGFKGRVRVVQVRRAVSGTGMTPDHIRVWVA